MNAQVSKSQEDTLKHNLKIKKPYEYNSRSSLLKYFMTRENGYRIQY